VSEPSRLRVLSIAHPAVLRDVGRRRYHPLATRPDLDVHLLVPKRWYQFGRWTEADPVDDPGVTMHIEPILFPHAPGMNWYLHVYPAMRRLIRKIRPDVIHLWEEPWSLVALQAALFRGRARLMLEVDQNILKRLPPPFEQIRRFVLKRTDHILARSPDAEAVVRACGYEGPSSFIAYGVDEVTFHPLPVPPVPHDGLRIGYVGRLVVEKGLDDMLDAMAMLPESVTLDLMGEGPHEGPLRERIARLGLGARVSFRPWGKAKDVADFIRARDVTLILTRTTAHVKEQFGRAIIESQACGAPIIGSTCGAIPHVIGAGGWVVPESNPEALAACIRDILANPDDRLARARAGIENVANRFTYARLAEQMAAAWHGVVTASGAENRPYRYHDHSIG
jgi:glycosyltransferase involved in cell wall biosynthesis